MNKLADSIPRVGLGTWELSGASCRLAVATALDLGYRMVDTAQGYQNEAEVGRALAETEIPRERLFVCTKVWPDDLLDDPGVVDDSLGRLRVGAVDLLLLHWPSPGRPLERTVEALARVEQRGKARAIGVSNFPPSQLERALEVCPSIACNQYEMHPYLQQRPLLDLCARLGLVAMAYCPLARGRVAGDPTLAAIGSRHGKTATQVALRWLLELGVVAIPKASSLDHLRENIDIFDFELSEAELEAIAALDRGERLINPDFAPDWEAA